MDNIIAKVKIINIIGKYLLGIALVLISFNLEEHSYLFFIFGIILIIYQTIVLLFKYLKRSKV